MSTILVRHISFHLRNSLEAPLMVTLNEQGQNILQSIKHSFHAFICVIFSLIS